MRNNQDKVKLEYVPLTTAQEMFDEMQLLIRDCEELAKKCFIDPHNRISVLRAKEALKMAKINSDEIL